MDTDITLAPVELNHLEQVIDLLQAISSFKPDPSDHADLWRLYKTQDHIHALVALQEDSVVGHAALLVERKIRGGLAGHIEDVVIHADFRGRGLGARLIQALEQKARELGCYKLSLHCEAKNAAFYKKLGFDLERMGLQKQLT